MVDQSVTDAPLSHAATNARLFAPGVALSAAVAVVAVLAAPWVAKALPIPAMVIALIIGIALNPVARNAVATRRPGADLTRPLVVATALACLLGAALLVVEHRRTERAG